MFWKILVNLSTHESMPITAIPEGKIVCIGGDGGESVSQYLITVLKYKYLQGGTKMKLSARNILKGKVIKIIPGAVNSEIILELPGGAQVVSIITKESAENLGLAVGKTAYAVIKASSVMIAVD
jgi:molybdopterin-binding protein